MKTLKRILLGLLIFLILFLLAGSLFVRNISRRALPDYNKDIKLNGISGEVKVYRDKYAVPHIYADNEKDLYRAVGYLMAQDRLWQMDLLRRITAGRLSEIFGKDYVNADQLFRSLHFSEKSRMVIKKCDPLIIDCLEAFADGVNQYIKDHQGKLPPEFTILGYKPEPWDPVHTANMIGFMAWDLSMAWEIETVIYKISQVVDDGHVKELIPDMELQQFYVHPAMKQAAYELVTNMDDAAEIIRELGLQVFKGSNNWVVSGNKSSTGKPLFANDMHLGLNVPGIWCQMHQIIPGKLNVTGVVLPGQPFIICGHNDKIAWGMTNVMLDDMDFYLETLNPEDTGLYHLNGNWVPLKLEEEMILTKEGDTVKRINRYTHRGPVISGFKKIKDKVISMKWIGMEFSNEIEAVYKFNRAGNWTEFRDAAKGFIAISQNIAYADTAGNIGMQTVAGIPIRQGSKVLFAPGDTSQFDWTGIVPFEELPSSFNPESGIVASANNRTIGDDYPYYISCWFDLPNRYQRITEVLSSKNMLGIEDFKTLQSDQNSKFAEGIIPVFLKALEPCIGEMNDIQKASLEYLKEWKFDMPVTSVASAVFECTCLELTRVIFMDELGGELYKSLIEQDLLPVYFIDGLRKKEGSVWCDNVATPDIKETLADNIESAFFAANDSLSVRLGNNVREWEWGKLHKLTLVHPLGRVRILDRIFNLNRGPYPVGGSFHTVSPYSFPWLNAFNSDEGSSHRHIYTVGDWNSSLTVIPTGNSGIPASKNYCDQTEMYLNYLYHPDPFSRDEVEKYAASRMSFRP